MPVRRWSCPQFTGTTRTRTISGTSFLARRAALAAQPDTISLPASGVIKERTENSPLKAHASAALTRSEPPFLFGVPYSLAEGQETFSRTKAGSARDYLLDSKGLTSRSRFGASRVLPLHVRLSLVAALTLRMRVR